MLSESQKIKKALKKVIAEEVQTQIEPCLKLYKGKITSAPNGTTCKVQLIGDSTEFALPYAEALEDLQVGALVWVGVPYGTARSMSNAIVLADIKFSTALPATVAHTKYLNNVSSTSAGVITLPVNTHKYTITRLTLVNYDTDAGSLSENITFVYGSTSTLYKQDVVGIFAQITEGNPTQITLASSVSGTFRDNDNMSVTVTYVKKTN